MTKKLYDLAVKTGTYKNSNGEEKGRWLNVGAVMQTNDGGKFIMLEKTFNPAGVPDLNGKGGSSVLLSMFEPKQQGAPQQQPKQPQPQAAPQQQGTPTSFDDDIPF